MNVGSLQPEQVARLKVFLCHTAADKATVRHLYRRLKEEGFNPWLDEEDLIPGQDWREEIPKAVRSADVVLVCLSNRSITKEGFVQKEIRFALDVADEKPPGTIFIIPVRLEAVELPSRLSQWQWANFFQQNGYERLVQALRTRANALGLAAKKTHTYPISYRKSDESASSRPASIADRGGWRTIRTDVITQFLHETSNALRFAVSIGACWGLIAYAYTFVRLKELRDPLHAAAGITWGAVLAIGLRLRKVDMTWKTNALITLAWAVSWSTTSYIGAFAPRIPDSVLSAWDSRLAYFFSIHYDDVIAPMIAGALTGFSLAHGVDRLRKFYVLFGAIAFGLSMTIATQVTDSFSIENGMSSGVSGFIEGTFGVFFLILFIRVIVNCGSSSCSRQTRAWHIALASVIILSPLFSILYSYSFGNTTQAKLWKALHYYNAINVKQDYVQAKKWFEEAAADGNTTAMYYMGRLYREGHGVVQDYDQARQWFEKAAADKDTWAMVSLGSLYYSGGHGLNQDYDQAMKWYMDAANGENASAMNSIGVLYSNGYGAPQDYERAFRWYVKAAVAGNTWGKHNIGYLYEYGQGVSQNYQKARWWYEKAAEDGNDDAMIRLGSIYQFGRGVEPDYEAARRWYKKAATDGNKEAKDLLEKLLR